jgi:hypothetical protein
MSLLAISPTWPRWTGNVWFECYPPDFDHGGSPLLGENPEVWHRLLEDVAFFAADCDLYGRVIVVVATVSDGFVEIRGQFVNQGEALAPEIGNALGGAKHRICLDKCATAGLGLEVELDGKRLEEDWEKTARRIELELLSTIARSVRDQSIPLV